jgi:acyl-CoA synthetase (AMP-forming)/AMP-acid ligase II
VSIADLAEHCGERGLAKQKAPEEIQFVAALPRNPMGKVLKHVLRAELLARSHHQER